MSRNDILRIGVRKAGNAGLVTATGPGTNDLLHTIPTHTVQQVTYSFSYVIRKVMWSNNTGVNGTLIIGTLSGTPALVQLLPTITCINGFDGERTELELPAVEFMSTTTVAAAALQRNGNAYVLSSVAGILVAIEVEEYRT